MARNRLIWIWLGAFVALGAWVGLSELNRLIGDLAVSDQTFDASAVYGPGVLLRPTAWRSALPAIDVWRAAWQSRGSGFTVVALLRDHLVFDLVFIAGYTLALLHLLPPDRTASPPRHWTVTRSLVVVVAGIDLVEDVIAWFALPHAVRQVPGSDAGFALGLLHAVTAIKWVAVLLLLLAMVRILVTQPAVRRGARRLGVGLKAQRYSAAIVVVLVALVASPSGEVGDQLPDVERAWLSGWQGALHALAAVLALLVVAAEVLYLGRAQSALASNTDDLPEPRFGGWIAFACAAYAVAVGAFATEHAWSIGLLLVCSLLPAVVVALLHRFRPSLLPSPANAAARRWSAVAIAAGSLLLALLAHGAGVTISWRRFGVLILIPAVIIVASSLLQARFSSRPWLAMRPAPPRDPLGQPVIVRTGDGIAAAVLAVAGVGLVRAYTAPAVVLGQGWARIGVVAGFVVAALVWPALWFVLPRIHRALSAPGESLTRTRAAAEAVTSGLRLPPVFALVGALVLAGNWALTVWLLLDPLRAAAFLGVAGTIVIALGGLASLLGLGAVATQRSRPWAVFRIMGFRVTPVLSILALIAVLSASMGTPDIHHDVRSAAPAAISPADRPDLPAAFEGWLAIRATDPAKCGMPVPTDAATPAPVGHPTRQLRVTPMVVVAAAGGGIRAAWWTVSGMDLLLSAKCGRGSVLASSGVSGGSVGLALVDRTKDPKAAVKRLAVPDALAAGTSGLLLTDILSGIGGVNVPPAGWPTGQPADRAAFIEQAWEREVGELTEPFLSPVGRTGAAGQLLLNSTSVTTHCRVLVSTMRVAPDVAPKPHAATAGAQPKDPTPPNCDTLSTTPMPSPGASAGSALLPDSYDLLSAYTNSTASGDLAGCRAGLSESTAAMLSARFPYVTPTGLMPACNGLAADQFVDGGYAESTALGTVADLGPPLMALVRTHNAQVLSGRASGPGSDLLVVPYLLFLENHFRLDIKRATPASEPELLAPVDTKAAAKQMGDTSALLQRATNELWDWLGCDPTDLACRKVVAAVDAVWRARTVVVAPGSAPRVEAPLGWVLSETSETSLDQSLRDARGACLGRHPRALAPCPAGVAHLNDLMAALGASTAPPA